MFQKTFGILIALIVSTQAMHMATKVIALPSEYGIDGNTLTDDVALDATLLLKLSRGSKVTQPEMLQLLKVITGQDFALDNLTAETHKTLRVFYCSFLPNRAVFQDCMKSMIAPQFGRKFYGVQYVDVQELGTNFQALEDTYQVCKSGAEFREWKGKLYFIGCSGSIYGQNLLKVQEDHQIFTEMMSPEGFMFGLFATLIAVVYVLYPQGLSIISLLCFIGSGFRLEWSIPVVETCFLLYNQKKNINMSHSLGVALTNLMFAAEFYQLNNIRLTLCISLFLLSVTADFYGGRIKVLMNQQFLLLGMYATINSFLEVGITFWPKSILIKTLFEFTSNKSFSADRILEMIDVLQTYAHTCDVTFQGYNFYVRNVLLMWFGFQLLLPVLFGFVFYQGNPLINFQRRDGRSVCFWISLSAVIYNSFWSMLLWPIYALLSVLVYGVRTYRAENLFDKEYYQISQEDSYDSVLNRTSRNEASFSSNSFYGTKTDKQKLDDSTLTLSFKGKSGKCFVSGESEIQFLAHVAQPIVGEAVQLDGETVQIQKISVEDKQTDAVITAIIDKKFPVNKQRAVRRRPIGKKINARMKTSDENGYSSFVAERVGDKLRYLNTTFRGDSGTPVLDEEYNVIGIHQGYDSESNLAIIVGQRDGYSSLSDKG